MPSTITDTLAVGISNDGRVGLLTEVSYRCEVCGYARPAREYLFSELNEPLDEFFGLVTGLLCCPECEFLQGVLQLWSCAIAGALEDVRRMAAA